MCYAIGGRTNINVGIGFSCVFSSEADKTPCKEVGAKYEDSSLNGCCP